MKCEMREKQGCYNCPAFDTAYCPEDELTHIEVVVLLIIVLAVATALAFWFFDLI